MTLEADLTLARQLADVADRIALERFQAVDLIVDTKPDLTPVTEADQAVERELRAVLEIERPGDAVLGEEYGTTGSGERTWILDPIDGTKNYVRGVPVWATLIGLREGSTVTVGVVSAPALGRRWWAASGLGAWATAPHSANPRALKVSAVDDLADASLSYSDAIDWPESGFSALLAQTWRQRGYGDFWSHVLVAEGAVDIAGEPRLAIHDMAALVPIIREAGGHITGFAGGDPLIEGNALTTNGKLHKTVLDLLKS
jgi:histidinol-phosphatase